MSLSPDPRSIRPSISILFSLGLLFIDTESVYALLQLDLGRCSQLLACAVLPSVLPAPLLALLQLFTAPEQGEEQVRKLLADKPAADLLSKHGPYSLLVFLLSCVVLLFVVLETGFTDAWLLSTARTLHMCSLALQSSTLSYDQVHRLSL